MRRRLEIVSGLASIVVLAYAIGDLAYVAGGVTGLALLGIVLLSAKWLIDKRG